MLNVHELQDDEYLAALQADREKELKAQQEAEHRLLEEATAREAALQKQKHEEEEKHRKQLEEEFLFDYIDIGKVVKPASYRLVRPYPRRTFTNGESELSLSELSLTSKQEVLFMELI
ncbi:hypothetical protein B296_00032000 [Ensete ventricosum]|uniref:UBX domain-containing protein n=1 Tax=Ensete ventricosum TaxID=4639 RepID=A0A427A7C3_ENSVE|nr:hypothetical protein B296_00032000 [Ensete ventricosum]